MTVDDLDFDKGGGLITVVTQHAVTGAVLMLAHMDREAFGKTVETGEMHYRSRTRGLWHKGATSGNIQRVVSLARDCDGDTILARVMPAGPACHNGTVSCFDQQPNGDSLTGLASVIDSRAHGAAHGAIAGHGYTQRLLADRNLRLKKLGEEAAELVLALADNDRIRAAEEGADVLYHMMVALRAQGVTLDDVRQVIANRADQHG
jgi:phosphoribosyl-AMP cyclohydrolase / phosphoribosyl-ATP pyrophosphohydrolase